MNMKPGNGQKRGNPFAPREYGHLVKVTDRVYLFRNIVNTHIVIGDRGYAIIDTQVNHPMARRVLEAARSVTDLPLLYTINTHYHWDHTNGNRVFKEAGATLVARQQTVDFMTQRAPRQKAFLASRGFPLGEDPFLAEYTFTDDIELDLGNQPVKLMYLGAAETVDATAVHIPAERCVVGGDSFMTGSFPIFGQPVMNEGLMDEHSWIDTIQAAREQLKPDHYLPGHGPLAGEKEIDFLIQIQRYFIEEVGKRVERGMKIQELLADLEPKLPEWITQIPEVWGTPRYAILRVYRGLIDDSEHGWQHFKPSVIPEADPEKIKQEQENLDGITDFIQGAEEAEEGGDLGLAIGLLREATKKYSEDPRGYIALADCLIKGSKGIASVLEKGDFFTEAQSASDRALEIDPNFGPAHLFKGQYQVMMSYRNGDDPTEGVTSLRKALEVGLDNYGKAQTHFFLGMAERTIGNENEAKKFFQQALSIEPAFVQAALAMR